MKPVQLKKRPSSKTARLVAALAMSSLGFITTAGYEAMLEIAVLKDISAKKW